MNPRHPTLRAPPPTGQPIPSPPLSPISDRRVHRSYGEVRRTYREAAVAARVTTLKGADAGAYYVEALPSYYLDADEPPGR